MHPAGPDHDLFEGQYTGLTEIGRGASSTVYRAFSPAFTRDVAIKLFHGSVDDADLRRRFQRECRVVGSLGEHPHVVSVFDSGFTRDRRPYLVMAYCGGGSFGQRLSARGARPVEEVAVVGLAVADALEAAHARGVVHRDVKPHNVLLTGYGVVALADFGVAIRGPVELTSLAATPGYAAPEVIVDHTSAGPAADVFAVGATLYALLTGGAPMRPQGGESELEFLLRAVAEPLAPLPDFVPGQLADVVHACLAREPGQRPGSAEELRSRLRAAVEEAGLVLPERLDVAPPAAASPARSEGHAASLGPAPSAGSPRGGRRPAAAAGGPAGVVGGFAAAAGGSAAVAGGSAAVPGGSAPGAGGPAPGAGGPAPGAKPESAAAEDHTQDDRRPWTKRMAMIGAASVLVLAGAVGTAWLTPSDPSQGKAEGWAAPARGDRGGTTVVPTDPVEGGGDGVAPFQGSRRPGTRGVVVVDDVAPPGGRLPDGDTPGGPDSPGPDATPPGEGPADPPGADPTPPDDGPDPPPDTPPGQDPDPDVPQVPDAPPPTTDPADKACQASDKASEKACDKEAKEEAKKEKKEKKPKPPKPPKKGDGAADGLT